MSEENVRLLQVLGETAPARELTADKTAFVMERDKSQITGFVVTREGGGVGIIDKSAVRWLTKDELWWLMHESKSPLNTRAADQERDLRGAVLDYLKHPSLDGSPIRQQKRDKLQTLAKIEKQQEHK